jgi:hypothetical protein
MKKTKTTIGELVDNYTQNMEMVKKIGVKGATRKLSIIRGVIKLLENFPTDDPKELTILEKLKDQALWINFAISRHRTQLLMSDVVKKRKTTDAREKRIKRQSWGGQTKEQLLLRNREIRESFNSSKLTINGFALRYAKKYKISSHRIRQIIQSQIDS